MIEINDEIVKKFWNAYVEGVQKAVMDNTFGYIVLNIKKGDFYFTSKAQFESEFPVIPVNYLSAKRIIPNNTQEHVILPEEEYPKVKRYLEYALQSLNKKE